MATPEAILKLVSDNSPESSCQQISKMFKDRPDALKDTIISFSTCIVNSLMNQQKITSDIQVALLTVLTNVLRQNSSRLVAEELVEGFKNALPQRGSKKLKRMRRFALVFCFSALSRAGLVKDDLTLLSELVNILNTIGSEHPCFYLLSLQLIIDLCDTNISSVDQFMDDILPIICPSPDFLALSTLQSDANAIYFWLKLAQTYPRIDIPPEVRQPLTPEHLTALEPALLDTSNFLPKLHPLWTLLAEFDPPTLLQLANQLWVENPTKSKIETRPLVTMAATAVLPYLAQTEVVSFLSNQKLFLTALSSQKNTGFLTAMKSAITLAVSRDETAAFSVFNALLSFNKPHSFVSELISSMCTSLTDAQTLRLLDQLTNAPFAGLLQLLWVQRHRESLNDMTVVKNIFAAASAAAQTEEDKNELSTFVANTMKLISKDKHTWFASIGNGIDPPTSEKSSSIEELVTAINESLPGLNAITSTLYLGEGTTDGNKMIVGEIPVELDAAVRMCRELARSQMPHKIAFSKVILGKSIHLLQPKHVSALEIHPELLVESMYIPELSSTALPLVMGLSEEDLKKVKIPPVPIPISSEDAGKLLQSSLNKCKRENTKKIDIINDLFNKVDDETAINALKSQILKILTEPTHISGGAAAISDLILHNTNYAFEVIQYLTEIAPQVKSQFGVKKLREWISNSTESSEIPVDSISNAVFAAINYDYSSDSAGRKKAEEAVKWAYKELRKAGPQAPREMFSQLADAIAQTGSRIASNTMRQIIKSK